MHAMIRSFIRTSLLAAALSVAGAEPGNSALWGARGERWTPQSRLPDFSHAGYHEGGAPLPDVPSVANVRDYGATGDGVTDDTAAFLKAIASVERGAIEVPPGRYVITNILYIRRSGVVLRGAGPDKSILFFPLALQEIKPNWGETTGGRPTSNYSWSGGFVQFQGSFRSSILATISETAERGDTTLQVSDASSLHIGQRIEIRQTDNSSNTLASELYSGDSGDVRQLRGSTRATMVCRVLKIEGVRIEIDRPLRFNLRAEWKPCVRSFEPTVTESGVENLGFEFPVTPYAGHFTEPGRNAAAFYEVADCWARNLRILNSDSGLFVNGMFCTVQNVVIESVRPTDNSNSTGHHGISVGGADNLVTGFDFRTRFIHDLTLDSCAMGNVFAGGRGVDLCFDHHKRTPYENLFTDIDVGAGTHVWRCGGGASLGKNCAARGTFWNIRAVHPLPLPPGGFGPDSMNFVAIQSDAPSVTEADGRWFESISPESIQPRDIHAAQLARRLGQ